MSNRKDAVLRMQFTLIPILMDSWKLTSIELNDLFVKYDILSYIDTCYEAFNRIKKIPHFKCVEH